MKRNLAKIVVFLLFGSLVVSSCWPSAKPASQLNINAQTAAAQTWEAISAAFTATHTPSVTPSMSPATATASNTPTATGTQTPIPSITPIPSSTATITPTHSTIASLTPISTSGGSSGGGGGGGGGVTNPTVTPVPCNHAKLAAHLTMPNGVDVPASTRFTKIWRIVNDGTCTWDENYSFVFRTGESFGAPMIVLLPRVVKPGEVVDISLAMVAPSIDGTFIGYWRLYDSKRKQAFGYGSENYDFPVSLRVYTKTTGVYFNYISHFCTANWKNSLGMDLFCPNPNKYYQQLGFVTLANKGLDYDPSHSYKVLWTHPDLRGNGSISGIYPYIVIPPNTKFVAEIGCLAGFPDCDVTFTLNYQVYGQNVTPYDSWNEVYDNQATRFEIFLDGLKNQLVSFQFNVIANGPINNAAAFWLNTQIQYLP